MKNNNSFDCIILAGGLGTRLQSVVPDVPKVLAPISGQPFLKLLLNYYDSFGCISNMVLAVGFRGSMIQEVISKETHLRFSLAFSVEDKLLGTGGAIINALPFTCSENVMVLNGDTFLEINLHNVIDYHKAKNADFTMVVRKTKDTSRFGTVLSDCDGRIVAFKEKQDDVKRGFINTGMYIFKRSIFAGFPQKSVLSLEKEILPNMLSFQGYQFISRGRFIDIGVPESYSSAEKYLSDFL